MAFSDVAAEQLSSIFCSAAACPEDLCRLSGVCREWRLLISGTRDAQKLWDTIGQKWWQPLLEKDRVGLSRRSPPRYGALELGIELDRFGTSTSRMELCYRQRMCHLLEELKKQGVTGKRSIETAEHLIGSGDYVDGRASRSTMRGAVRRGLIAQILVSEHSPFPCHWDGPCGGECAAFGDADCSETDEEADDETVRAQRERHEHARAKADDEAREENEAQERERLNGYWNDCW